MPDAQSRLMLKIFRLAERAGQDGAALEAALAEMPPLELEQLEQMLRRLLEACPEGARPA